MTTATENEKTIDEKRAYIKELLKNTQCETFDGDTPTCEREYVTFDGKTATLKLALDKATASKGQSFFVPYKSFMDSTTEIEDIMSEVKKCDLCGQFSDEFYLVGDNLDAEEPDREVEAVYCSQTCIENAYTPEQYEKLCEDGKIRLDNLC